MTVGSSSGRWAQRHRPGVARTTDRNGRPRRKTGSKPHALGDTGQRVGALLQIEG
jgi:hypothetical protein